jgi:predicted nucleic acid-binding protein
MRVLVDTNIVIDFLAARDPFYEDSCKIFTMVELEQISGFFCATTITTIHYLIAKEFDKPFADNTISNLLKIFDITDVNKNTLVNALRKNDIDFEDSVIYVSAEFAKIDTIITRDNKGFEKSNIRTKSPTIFLQEWHQ